MLNLIRDDCIFVGSTRALESMFVTNAGIENLDLDKVFTDIM